MVDWVEARSGRRQRETAHYESAAVCGNGHTITCRIETAPERLTKFCRECGSEAITACSCGAHIPGYYNVPGVVVLSAHYQPPNYCGECGQPFPWLAAKLNAANELADELEGLGAADLQKIKDSIPELARDSAKSSVAAARIGKLWSSLKGPVGEGLRKLIVEVATEASKKAMGL